MRGATLTTLLLLAACYTPGAGLVDACADAARHAGGTAGDRELRGRLHAGLRRLARNEDTARIEDLAGPGRSGAARLELPALRGEPVPADRLFDELRDAVVVVGRLYECKRCPRQHLTTSTGFFVSSTGAFVTNAHVLEGGPRDPVGIMTADGRVVGVGPLLALDKERDLAVAQAKGTGFVPLPVDPEPRVGGSAHVISHPASHYYVFTSGVVARARRDELLITADYARGSSGAPVLDDHGNVVGVVSATRSIYTADDHGAQKNLQMVLRYAVPGAALADVLRAAAAR